MDRRKFFKNLAAGTAAATVAATIPASILKIAEEKVKELGGQPAEYLDWSNEFVMWDTICFKGDPFWLAAVTGIFLQDADVIVELCPYQIDEGPEGEPKGAKFHRTLPWLKENTLLFKNERFFRNTEEYGHYEQNFTHGWKN